MHRIAAALAITFTLVVSPARGSDSLQDDGLTLDMTRMVIMEGRWSVSEPEIAALVHVILKRADRNRVSVRTAMLHSRPVRRCRSGVSWSNRWGCFVTRGARAPRFWPRGVRWELHRPIVASVYDVVARVLAGDLEDPCPDALHWGGPPPIDPPQGDMVRTCRDLDARNRFWANRRVLDAQERMTSEQETTHDDEREEEQRSGDDSREEAGGGDGERFDEHERSGEYDEREPSR